MKNIAIIHYSGPPVIGGVEIVVEAHARYFAEAGYNTRLIVGDGEMHDRSIRTIVIPEIASRGGPLAKQLRELSAGHLPARFEKSVSIVEKKLSAAIRNVDVCMIHNVMTMHFNLVLTAALANIIRRRTGMHFIAWTHDLTFADPVYERHQHLRYPWNLLLQALPNCHYFVISRQRQEETKALFNIPTSKLPIVPDGIDVPALLGLTPPLVALYNDENLSDVDIIAMTPARILRRKNLGIGMEIMAALKRRKKEVRWLITGAPDPHNAESRSYYRMLLSLRRRLGLQKEVIFLCERFENSVSKRDVRGLYSLSDVLLFPSEREGFGLPLLEAGLRRILVVINDIPVLRELAGSHAIYMRVSEPLEKTALKIIRELRRRPEVTYRKKIMKTYSWRKVFHERILPLTACIKE